MTNSVTCYPVSRVFFNYMSVIFLTKRNSFRTICTLLFYVMLLTHSPFKHLITILVNNHHQTSYSSLLTSSIDLTEVWESPHITKTHCKANAGQQILDLVIPFGTLSSLLPHTVGILAVGILAVGHPEPLLCSVCGAPLSPAVSPSVSCVWPESECELQWGLQWTSMEMLL